MEYQFTDRRCLIIGGLGFIGSSLAHRLVEGGARVTLFDACLDPYGWNPANIREIAEQVEVVTGDVRSAEQVARAVEGQDWVFSFAGQVSRIISMQQPQLDLDINCQGALNVLEACRQRNPEARLVFAGSRAAFGEARYLPVDEEHPDRPTDLYGVNKLAAEHYHLTYHRAYGTRAVSLRFNNVYGPRCQVRHGHYGVLNLFVRRALQGESLTVYGTGEQKRDYIYIDDVVEACVAAAANPASEGEMFTVGSGVGTRFLDMAKLIAETAGGTRLEHVPFPPEIAKIDIGDFYASTAKMERVLGWRPQVSLEEGVRRTVEFYRERLAEYL